MTFDPNNPQPGNDPAPNVDPTPTPDPAPTPTPEPKPAPKNDAQARINQLYGQKRQAEEASAQLRAENEGLRTQLLSTQEQIALLRSQMQPQMQPQQNQPVPTLYQQNPAVVPPVAGQGTPDVKQAVEEVVGPFIQQLTADREAQMLRAAQEQSWGTAISTNPALNDVNSELYKTAQEIWGRDSQLQRHPHGPMLAAALAKDLLGQPAPQSNVDPNLLNAANVAPGTGPTEGAQKKEIETLRAQYDAVVAEMRSNPGATDRLYPQYRELRHKIGLLEEQKKG